MVGDRMHDIRAARVCRTASLGVLWGYGGEAELRDGGANQFISKPYELSRAVVM